MKFLNLTFVFLGSLLWASNEVYSETYAILFTGIKHWNIGYPFEGAVARFYDTIYKNGIPKKNILTMTPNEIAYNRFNPYPGVIMHGINGSYIPGETVNYNQHLEIDYDTELITKESFYEILAGNKTAAKEIEKGSGRVLEWGPKDTVIIYFTTFSTEVFSFFNMKSLIFTYELRNMFEKLQERKPFRTMKLILDTNFASELLGTCLSPDEKILGYAFGVSEMRLDVCTQSNALDALTGLCSSIGFFEILEKFKKTSNSSNRPLFDLFMDHRRYLSEVQYARSPNMYGRLELAGQPFSTFFGKKEKKSPTEKCTEQDTQSEAKTKAMMADAIKNHRSLGNFIQDMFISSAAERHRIINVIPTIAIQAIEGTKINEDDLDEPTTHLSPAKLKIFEKVVHVVKSNCFSEMNLLLFTSLPFEKLFRVVDLDVSDDRIKDAIKSVCQ